jgi:porin
MGCGVATIPPAGSHRHRKPRLPGALIGLAAAMVALAASRANGASNSVAPDDNGTEEGIAAPIENESVRATWEDLRRDAARWGVEISLVYDGEGFANVTGGDRTGSAYVGNLHLQLTVDGGRLFGWPGLTVFFHGLGTHGGHPSSLVGDAQGMSNLEAPAGWQLYEAWLQQNLVENRVSALVGRYDLGTEFYRLQSAALFLNSSFGTGPEFSQSGHGGPSIFPDTSVGIRLAFKPSRGVVLRLAVLDGVPADRPDSGQHVWAKGDGLLLVAEAALLGRPLPEGPSLSHRFRIGRGAALNPYDGKLAVGGWYYTAEFDDLSERALDGRPVVHRGSGGAYLLTDQLVYRSDAQPRRQINAFAQFGIGDSRVNRFGYYGGGGVVFSGLLPMLQNDELGLAVAIARNGSHFIDLQRDNGAPVTGTETALELTELLQIGKHVALQPDLQYVMRPGTDSTRQNALAVALRFELAY